MLVAGSLFLDDLEASVGIFGCEGQRRVGRQRLRQHDRPRAGSAAAMRGREGLVQVDVHRIDAKVAGTDLADDRVEVGAVAIDEAAGGMNRVADRPSSRGSNRPQVLGLVIITAATSGPKRAFSASRSTRPAVVRGDILDAIAAEGSSRRVGAMRALGHKHHLARVAPRLERGTDAEQAAQLAMCAGLGAHRDAVHAGQRDQPLASSLISCNAPWTVSCGWSG